jgi:hypothetical protein
MSKEKTSQPLTRTNSENWGENTELDGLTLTDNAAEHSANRIHDRLKYVHASSDFYYKRKQGPILLEESTCKEKFPGDIQHAS